MTSTIVISGANRGIGLALCRAWLAKGAHVIALCRRASTPLRDSGATILDGVDVTDQDALGALHQRLDVAQIDVLINNAGILSADGWTTLDPSAIDAIRRQFEVNALAPLALTRSLARKLGDGSRVAIITSQMGSISDNTSGGYYGYRASKAAVNIIGRSMAIDLESQGVAVALIHPGYVRTDMTGGHGHIDTNESASGIVRIIEQLDLTNSGSFWHANGSLLSW